MYLASCTAVTLSEQALLSDDMYSGVGPGRGRQERCRQGRLALVALC